MSTTNDWRQAPRLRGEYDHTQVPMPEVVTQFVARRGYPKFHSEPRWDMEEEVSVTAGRLSPQEMRRLVAPHSPVPQDGDAVRYFETARLFDEGFLLTYAPSQRNRDHWMLARLPRGKRESWTVTYRDGTLEKVLDRCICGIRRKA